MTSFWEWNANDHVCRVQASAEPECVRQERKKIYILRFWKTKKIRKRWIRKFKKRISPICLSPLSLWSLEHKWPRNVSCFSLADQLRWECWRLSSTSSHRQVSFACLRCFTTTFCVAWIMVRVGVRGEWEIFVQDFSRVTPAACLQRREHKRTRRGVGSVAL